MNRTIKVMSAALLLAAVVALFSASTAIAQDVSWRISKSSGEVWLTASGAQPAALTPDASLKAGDTIRTGASGRVQLSRGSETILVSPNSIMGLPAGRKSGPTTTILHQAGTILLEVEKRNVQHFEVTTPYLAAVVKGTQFRVTVNRDAAQVDVLRGQVQVADYKTGQYALVNSSQVARVSLQGTPGLSLSGSGALSPIQRGPSGGPPVAPAPEDRAAAPAPAPTQTAQQTQTPAPVAPRIETRWASSETKSGSSGWTDEIMKWVSGIFGAGDRKRRDDDLTLILALPLGIGFSVAIGAAALRRRRKGKQQDDR